MPKSVILTIFHLKISTLVCHLVKGRLENEKIMTHKLFIPFYFKNAYFSCVYCLIKLKQYINMYCTVEEGATRGTTALAYYQLQSGLYIGTVCTGLLEYARLV